MTRSIQYFRRKKEKNNEREGEEEKFRQSTKLNFYAYPFSLGRKIIYLSAPIFDAIACLSRNRIPSVVKHFWRKKFERSRPGWKVLASTGRGPVARQLPAWWKVCELFSGVGVYISRVEEGSVAERAGLRPGDTILEVNGTPFRAVTHEEALKVSFYFHFPNQKHFLARVTVYHGVAIAIPILSRMYNEAFFSFFFFSSRKYLWRN